MDEFPALSVNGSVGRKLPAVLRPIQIRRPYPG